MHFVMNYIKGKTMLDINELDITEEKKLELTVLMEELVKITKWSKELSERRGNIMESFKEFFDTENIESIEIDGYGLSTTIRKGSAKWDASRLNKILEPEQLEEVYSVGKSTSYLRLNIRERDKS